MKRIDENTAALFEDVREEMRAQGFNSLSFATFEKDILVTEVIGAVARAVTQPGYTPVFCGGTCLSKVFGALERMSEDVDFKIVRDTTAPAVSKSQQRRDLGEIKQQVRQALADLGYRAEDIAWRARDGNQYTAIELHYESLFDSGSESLRDHIQLELNCTGMQRPSVRQEVSRLIDPFLAPAARSVPMPVSCVSGIEAVTEKLISFPRRLAMAARRRERGEDTPTDPTLVRHIHDVARMMEKFPRLASKTNRLTMREMLRNLMFKDGIDFRYQHPEFVDDAHGELRYGLDLAQTDAVRADYARFLADMVYAPQARQPSFESAMTVYRTLVESLIDEPSPDIKARIALLEMQQHAREQAAAPKPARPRAPKRSREEWEAMQRTRTQQTAAQATGSHPRPKG